MLPKPQYNKKTINPTHGTQIVRAHINMDATKILDARTTQAKKECDCKRIEEPVISKAR
jgi:hypothetical protein